MRLLAIDAALDQCSVALMEGGACLGSRQGGDSRAATASLPALVHELLDDHGPEFDAVAATIGPGSFTGLRGALALAHGLALGAGVPIVGVTVAEALLERLGPYAGEIWVALDSRRAGRIFLCRGTLTSVEELTALPAPAGPIGLIGNAAAAAGAALREAGAAVTVFPVAAVAAADVGLIGLKRIAGHLVPLGAQPLYIDAPEARSTLPLRPAPV